MGLPWQIEILQDGSTEVFGLRIGTSRLSGAIEKLGSDMELAIVAATDEGSNEIDLKRWRENALRFEYMETGLAKKYILSPDDLPQVLDEVITGMTFLPAVNLDEKVILARFGEPEKRVQFHGVIHFLYPEKGLDLALHEDSKEVLQYVRPDAFHQLIQPLAE